MKSNNACWKLRNKVLEDNFDVKFCDIWMAEIGDNNGSVQSGIRPVLIISNDKNNKYSTVINIIPMTTKMNKKNLPCHVEIWNYGKYGLTSPSTIMIEQITSIPKNNLICKIGKLHNANLLMQICRAMRIQFPLLEIV